MNLEQLQAQSTKAMHLIHRVKALQELSKNVRETDDIGNASHQVLQMVHCERGKLMVQALIAGLMELEARALAEQGVDLTELVFHNHFPGVLFSGFSFKDRENGSPLSQVEFPAGADGAVVRAVQHVCGANGVWELAADGRLTMTVSQDRQYVAAGEGKGVPE